MADEFKPTIGSRITKAQAIEWSEKFDKERRKDTKSVFFGRDAILTILADSRATGITFMFARKYDDKQKKDIDDLVMVGTTEEGTLLWDAPTTLTLTTQTSQTYDGGSTCPPYCPK
jgi:hypothetical protein